MILDGTIELKKSGSKIETDGEEDAEFYLTIDMREDDISIGHEASESKSYDPDYGFYIYLQSSEKKQLGININYQQAQALRDLLENYINARNLVYKLYEPIAVKAA